MSMLMDFRRACGFWPGGRYQKRPMVWDTREVCETTSCTQHNANISPWAPFWHYSLASKSEPEVDLYGVSVAFPCLPLPSQARVSQKCIFTTFWHNSQHLHPSPSLQASVLAFSTSLVSSRWCVDTIFTSTSLACKIMSMLVNPSYCLHQIYNLARLHGSVNWHFKLHCTCEVYWLALGKYLWTGLGTPGFLKTLTWTHWNPYPWGRCGFLWVWVWVALEYPRVTHDNPYLHLPCPPDWANLVLVGHCCTWQIWVLFGFVYI